MPSHIDEAGHTKAFGYPVAEHWGESRNVQFPRWDSNRQHIGPESNALPTEPPQFPLESLELPLNGGHVFATVAHKELVFVHATGHTSGDGVCNTVDLKAKKGDRKDL